MSNVLPKRILVVCQDNIGDLVFTSSSIVSIGRHFKDEVIIDLMIKDYTAEVADFLPLVSRVLQAKSISRLSVFPWSDDAKEFKRINLDIANGRYDVAILVGKNWRLGYLCWKAGIPIRIGFDFPKLKIWLTHPVSRPTDQVPVLVGFDTLLKKLGVYQDSPAPYQLDFKKVLGAQCRLRNKIIDSGSECQWFNSAKRVGLHAFAGKSDRCVPLNVWIETARKLEANGWSVVWLGTANELKQLKREDSVPGFYSDEIGSGSISDSIALLSYCMAYIGHDSGVLHLASAIGVRTLGIFAPGQPERTFAQGIAGGLKLFKSSPELISSEMMMEYFQRCFQENSGGLYN